MTTAQGCCGRPAGEQCRCHTDAAAIVEAVRSFIRRPRMVAACVSVLLNRPERYRRALADIEPRRHDGHC